MAGDDAFLVRGQYPGRDPATRRADARTTGGICLRIEPDAQPSCALAHRFPHAAAVLADAAGEDDRIEVASERRGERTELAPDAVDEESHRSRRFRRVARFQHANVARQS